MGNNSNTDRSVIKIFVKNIKAPQSLKEIKGSKEFKYTPEFIKSYKKPGYYVRFSNETDKDSFMLTPNFSKYSHAHTPIAIYGYPLDSENVIEKLFAQRLYFQNSDLIIVYRVDPSNITKVEELSKKFPDFLDKLKSKFGEEKVKEAALNAYKKDKENYGNIFRYSLEKNDPLNFYAYANSPWYLSRIYWTILKTVANSSQQTAFLYAFKTPSLTFSSPNLLFNLSIKSGNFFESSSTLVIFDGSTWYIIIKSLF